MQSAVYWTGERYGSYGNVKTETRARASPREHWRKYIYTSSQNDFNCTGSGNLSISHPLLTTTTWRFFFVTVDCRDEWYHCSCVVIDEGFCFIRVKSRSTYISLSGVRWKTVKRGCELSHIRVKRCKVNRSRRQKVFLSICFFHRPLDDKPFRCLIINASICFINTSEWKFAGGTSKTNVQ